MNKGDPIFFCSLSSILITDLRDRSFTHSFICLTFSFIICTCPFWAPCYICTLSYPWNIIVRNSSCVIWSNYVFCIDVGLPLCLQNFFLLTVIHLDYGLEGSVIHSLLYLFKLFPLSFARALSGCHAIYALFPTQEILLYATVHVLFGVTTFSV
jgi:hypothetical protein